MGRARTTVALLFALAGTGCAADATGIAEGAIEEGSVGVLHVERVDGIERVEGAGRTELSAAFARYRDLDAGSVLALLGSRSVAELETCAFVGADDALAGADDPSAFDASGEVELLDVGTIQVRVAGTEASLAPRAFPDLASVVAGVFYAGDATLPIPTADVDEYAFVAAGGEEVPAFRAVVPAPAELDELALAQIAQREVGLDVAWLVPASGSDVIEIEVRSQGDVLACAAHDDGAFRIDAESLATLAPDADATVVVRRVRVSPVDVPGLDDAFARIAVGRELDLDLR